MEQALDIMRVGMRRLLQNEPLWLLKKHRTWSQYARYCPARWIDWSRLNCTAAFVRHPVAYYESVWRWLKRTRHRGRKHFARVVDHWAWHPHSRAAELYGPDFSVWVERILEDQPAWYTRLVEMYVGPCGGEVCDFVGRTETLTRDFLRLMHLLGYGESLEQNKMELFDLPRQGESKYPRPAWNDGLQERMLKVEHEVVDRFYGGQSERRLYGRWREEGIQC